jgi:hypothetical protein
MPDVVLIPRFARAGEHEHEDPLWMLRSPHSGEQFSVSMDTSFHPLGTRRSLWEVLSQEIRPEVFGGSLAVLDCRHCDNDCSVVGGVVMTMIHGAQYGTRHSDNFSTVVIDAA